MVSDFLCNSPKSKANMKKMNTTKDSKNKVSFDINFKILSGQR